MASFEMSKPKLNEDKDLMRFNLKGIGKNNEDEIIGLTAKRLANISLFIDDAGDTPGCYANCEDEILSKTNMIDANLRLGNFTDADLKDANLTGAGWKK